MEELTKLRPKDRSRNKLEQTIRESGIPIDGISGFPPTMRLDMPLATESQKIVANTIADKWDWSTTTQEQRDKIKSKHLLRELLEGNEILSLVVRGLLKMIRPNNPPSLSQLLDVIEKE